MLTALLTSWATAPSVDPVSWLINYGVAGAVIILLVTGQLRTKSEVLALQKIAEDRAKEIATKEAALAALMQQLSNHTVPQLGRLASVVENIPQPRNSEMDMLRRLEALTGSITNVETEILSRMEDLAKLVETNSRRIERIEGGGSDGRA